MSISNNESRSAKEERLKNIRESIKLFSQEEAVVARELGVDAVEDIRSKHRLEDDAETLYDRMTPAEMMKLYETDRQEWKRILDAKRAAGERKLMKWR